MRWFVIWRASQRFKVGRDSVLRAIGNRGGSPTILFIRMHRGGCPTILFIRMHRGGIAWWKRSGLAACLELFRLGKVCWIAGWGVGSVRFRNRIVAFALSITHCTCRLASVVWIYVVGVNPPPRKMAPSIKRRTLKLLRSCCVAVLNVPIRGSVLLGPILSSGPLHVSAIAPHARTRAVPLTATGRRLRIWNLTLPHGPLPPPAVDTLQRWVGWGSLTLAAIVPRASSELRGLPFDSTLVGVQLPPSVTSTTAPPLHVAL